MRLASLLPLLLARAAAAMAPPSEGLSRRALLSAAAAALSSCPAALARPAPAQATTEYLAEKQPAIFGFTPDSFIAPPPSSAPPGVPPPAELDLDALPDFPNPFRARGPKPPAAPPSIFGFTPESFVAPAPSSPSAPGALPPPPLEMDLNALPDFPFGGFGAGGGGGGGASAPPSAPVTSSSGCARYKTEAARAYCEKQGAPGAGASSVAPSAASLGAGGAESGGASPEESAARTSTSEEKDLIEIYKSNNYFVQANRAQQDAIRNLFGFPPTRRPGEPPPPPPPPLFYSPFASSPPPPPVAPARPPLPTGQTEQGSLYSQELLESMEESKQLREVYKAEGYFRAANRAQWDSIRNLFGFGPAMRDGKPAPPPPPSIFGNSPFDREETKIVWGWDLYKKITSGS